MKLAGAAGDFSHALSLNRTYAYDVLWLHIARIRSGVHDAKELTANAAPLDHTKWPAPVVSFYQGKMTPAHLLAVAKTGDQRCEANFYIAEWQLAQRHVAPARAGFKVAVKTCPITFVEYGTAKAELRRL